MVMDVLHVRILAEAFVRMHPTVLGKEDIALPGHGNWRESNDAAVRIVEEGHMDHVPLRGTNTEYRRTPVHGH